MAREVNSVLSQILSENRGITEAKAEEIVKNMRAANQYQVSSNPRSLLGLCKHALTWGCVGGCLVINGHGHISARLRCSFALGRNYEATKDESVGNGKDVLDC
jgi:hypothetical protein